MFSLPSVRLLVLLITCCCCTTTTDALQSLKTSSVNDESVLLRSTKQSFGVPSKKNHNNILSSPSSSLHTYYSPLSSRTSSSSLSSPTALYQLTTVKDLTPTISRTRQSNIMEQQSGAWRFTTSTSSNDGLVDVVNGIVQPVSMAITTVAAQLLMMSGTVYQTTITGVESTKNTIQNFIRQYWWSFPLTLCIAPFVHHVTFQSAIATPHFWKMVNLNYIFHSPYATTVLSCFLGSNVAYFLTGAYLLHKFPARSLKPGMGAWMLTAGFVSTVFHTVQAIGDYHIAEALCYIDHGIAGAATFYFWHVCGHPPKTAKFWTLAIAGLVALSCPFSPGYAWLHSTWHFLSAGVALVWAFDGKLQRKQRLFEAVRCSRKQQKFLSQHQLLQSM